MPGNRSIRDFFKPAQPAPKPANLPLSSSQPSSNFKVPSVPLAAKASITTKPTIPPFAMGQAKSSVSNLPDQRGYTSSLSPPPTSDPSEPSPSPSLSPSPGPVSPPQKENVPPQAFSSISSNNSAQRVIQNSDDEDEDSDSSLEDLAALLAAKSSEIRGRQAINGIAPSTPVAPRHQTRAANFHTSPLPVLSKYKFDLKSLVSHAERAEATEASSKRVKAIMAAKDEIADDDTTMILSDHTADPAKFAHGALLESVVADREDGGTHKVTRAIMRTEATVTEKRWYFFDTQSKASKSERKPFPTRSVPENWEKELVNPKTRHQTFVSGFAEDMVTFGKKLPDELFLWILDEACLEASDPLRTSYLNTIRESKEQIQRLLSPDLIRKLFRVIGGSSNATEISQKVVPVAKLADPYSNRDWARLLSIIRFLGQIGKSLQQASRTNIICMLLRMSVDHVVFENVDLLDSVQETIGRLCRYTPDEDWETCVRLCSLLTSIFLTAVQCQKVCKPLFDCVGQPTLRLQIVDSISSITPRTHDLRRRLAMCFYFDDIVYSKAHSHSIMDLDVFIKRLDDPAFDTNAKTDYRELTALILLLDIAADDGRSMNLDLSDKATEAKFDEKIEMFGATIKDIMRSIGNPGAAFISRIEAKEVLELVSQRISDTLRSKPKAKQTWFDKARGKPEEDLDSERRGMQSFISRVKEIGNGVNGQGPK